ncbi:MULTISPECIES: hypothetical protein [unclassified Eikenella]|nr:MULTISPECIES: hypothetical protein [unclassified Eikenella]
MISHIIHNQRLPETTPYFQVAFPNNLTAYPAIATFPPSHSIPAQP